jgi:hypothetical protein
MNTGVKVIVSILLVIVALFCLGLWPYIPVVGVLVSLGLAGAAIAGIFAVWKKRPSDGEGDVFKKNDTLNKN